MIIIVLFISINSFQKLIISGTPYTNKQRPTQYTFITLPPPLKYQHHYLFHLASMKSFSHDLSPIVLNLPLSTSRITPRTTSSSSSSPKWNQKMSLTSTTRFKLCSWGTIWWSRESSQLPRPSSTCSVPTSTCSRDCSTTSKTMTSTKRPKCCYDNCFPLLTAPKFKMKSWEPLRKSRSCSGRSRS